MARSVHRGSGMPASLDVRALLDPEVAAALAAFPLALGSLSAETLPMIREAFRNLPPVPLSVSVRVHRVKSAAGTLPCIYWMHGGGLILGTNKADDARFDRWCQRLNCVGV